MGDTDSWMNLRRRRAGAWHAAAAAALLALAGCGGGGSTATPDVPGDGDPTGPADPVITVVDDSLTVRWGDHVDVLANDLIDGVPVRVAPKANPNATYTWDEPVYGTLNFDGADGLWNSLPPGDWTLRYTVCAIDRPAACANGVAALRARLGPLRARDDALTAWIDGEPANVLTNDEETLGALPPRALAVGRDTVVRAVGALPAGVDLSASGQVMVFAGVALDVPLAVDYEVCAIHDAGNCARARATVTVPGGGLLDGEWTGGDVSRLSLGTTVSIEQAPWLCGYDDSECGVAYRIQTASLGLQHLIDRTDGLALPLDTVDVRPGHAVVGRAIYYGPGPRLQAPQGNQVVEAGFDATWTWAWTDAQDALGASRPVALAGSHSLAEDLLTEIPLAGSTARPSLFLVLPFHARFDDGAEATRLTGATVSVAYARRTPDPWLDVFLGKPLQMFRFDADAGRWQPEGPATLTVDAQQVRAEATFDRPGLWAIGAALPGVTLTGCATDAYGRPAAGVSVAATSLTTRALTRTDALGRFAVTVPADTVLELALLGPAWQTWDTESRMRAPRIVGPFAAAGDAGPCLSALVPRLTIDFPPILVREPDGSAEAVYADPAIDAPDGTRMGMGFPLVQPWVGTYRVYMPSLSNGYSSAPPPITVTVADHAPQRVQLSVSDRDAPRYWHLYDIDVDARCGAVVRRVGKPLDELPALAPRAAVACQPPQSAARR